MDSSFATLTLAALAQPTRLEAFRRLVARLPDGLPAGELAQALAVPQNTLSSHLAILQRAGLVTSEKRGRLIVYRADLDTIRGLAMFLLADCCGGHPDLCLPIITEITPCCAAKASANA